jgi:hypothetical protein
VAFLEGWRATNVVHSVGEWAAHDVLAIDPCSAVHWRYLQIFAARLLLEAHRRSGGRLARLRRRSVAFAGNVCLVYALASSKI